MKSMFVQSFKSYSVLFSNTVAQYRYARCDNDYFKITFMIIATFDEFFHHSLIHRGYCLSLPDEIEIYLNWLS